MSQRKIKSRARIEAARDLILLIATASSIGGNKDFAAELAMAGSALDWALGEDAGKYFEDEMLSFAQLLEKSKVAERFGSDPVLALATGKRTLKMKEIMAVLMEGIDSEDLSR